MHKCKNCHATLPPWQKKFEVTYWRGGLGFCDGEPYCKPCATRICAAA